MTKKKPRQPRKTNPHREYKLAVWTLVAAVVTLVVAVLSYYPGLGSVRDMVVRSRCSAGAFQADAQPPATLTADSQDTRATSAAVQDPTSSIVKPVNVIGANLIPNPGAEVLAGELPKSWAKGQWGKNTTVFSTVAGHGSKTALRVNMTTREDGGAFWHTGKTQVNAGKYYVFSNLYRSDSPTAVTVMLKSDQGAVHYFTPGNVPAAAGWTAYSTRFFVPAGVREIEIYQSLDQVGWLESDNYSLTEAEPRGFATGMVSVTFDDSWKSIHKNALPIMKKLNIVSTQYLLTGYLGEKHYMNEGDVFDFIDAGHEVGSHSVDHPDLTKLNDKQLKYQVAESAKGLKKCYGMADSVASPMGKYDTRTTGAMKPIYRTHRTTDAGFISADFFNPYELKVQSIYTNTTQEEIEAWLQTAKTNKVWLILVYHEVDSGPSEFARTPAVFEQDMKKVASSGLKIRTVSDAYTIAEATSKH